MKRIFASVLILACLQSALPPHCAAEESAPSGNQNSEDLLVKQRDQEKARALAAKLVSGVLDIQLRQLKENNLDALPIYKDIRDMRKNINALIDQEMQQAIESLVQAQSGTRENRLKHFEQARLKIREIVLTLTAERHKLHKRLHAARISADVRELLALQTKAYRAVLSLPELTRTQRERITLTAIEDQGDVKLLFDRLGESLQEVSSWDGPIGAAAADGLRILKAAQVEAALSAAKEKLQLGDSAAAAKSQSVVIQGLRALLERVDKARGLNANQRERALAEVREMIRRQSLLRSQTRDADLASSGADQLIGQQTAIQKDLAALAESMQRFTAAAPFFEIARAASFQAVDKLFENAKADALNEQGKIVAGLTQIEQQLLNASDEARRDKSAEHLAAEISQLERLRDQLQAAAKHQTSVLKNVEDNLTAAAKQQQNSAMALDKIPEADIPAGTIASRLADAREQAQAVAELLQKPTFSDPPQPLLPVIASAARALSRTQSEVEARLADLRRRHLAVVVGELARAAEALERAASSERNVANTAEKVKQTKEITPEQTGQLTTEQQDVVEVAKQTRQGVENLSPASARLLSQAEPNLKELQQLLDQLMPPTKQAPLKQNLAKTADKIAAQAKQAAKLLEQAAAELRKSAGQASRQLVKVSDEQLKQVAQSRDAVDVALAEDLDGDVQALSRLQDALGKLRQANVEQLRAAGRSEAAAAQELVDDIEKALASQEEAQQAVGQLTAGKVNSPNQAATEQQKTAEMTARLAKESSGALANALARSAQSMVEAARETLSRNSRSAGKSRQAARRALEKARQLAQAASNEAAQKQPGSLDAQAQQRAASLAASSGAAAGSAAPGAAAALAQAKQSAAAARQAIRNNDASAAASHQQAAASALAEAGKRFAQARKDLAGKIQQKNTAKSRQAGKLAQLAEKIDSAAGAALRRAEQTARQLAARQDANPFSTRAGQEAFQGSLEQAAASLTARQQKIFNDRMIAETLAELALQQQESRDEIAAQAAILEKMAAEDKNKMSHPTAAQMRAAEALEDASDQFAQAQRAMGQGAVEISGQEQVANLELRKALEAASRLGRLFSSHAAADQMADGDQGGSAGEPGENQTAAGDSSNSPGDDDTDNPTAQGPQSDDSSLAQGRPGDGKGDGGQNSQAKNNELGTKLVPKSPEATADQIAGESALAQASRFLQGGRAQEKGEGEAESSSDRSNQNSNQSQNKSESESKQQSASQSSGASPSESESQDKQDSDEEIVDTPPTATDSRSDDRGEDTELASRRYRNDSWFAKLPPSLRKAIEAKTRRPAPRGYKERLRRYFESID